MAVNASKDIRMEVHFVLLSYQVVTPPQSAASFEVEEGCFLESNTRTDDESVKEGTRKLCLLVTSDGLLKASNDAHDEGGSDFERNCKK